MKDNKYFDVTALALFVLTSAIVPLNLAQAVEKENTVSVYGDFRLRYEGVSQDTPLSDADALSGGIKFANYNAGDEVFNRLMRLTSSLRPGRHTYKQFKD